MNIINIKLSDLKPYERNPRNNKEAELAKEMVCSYGFDEDVAIVNDKYVVTKNGEVYTVHLNKKGIKKQKLRMHSNGYIRATLFERDYYVHRLVAFCFIENPHGYKEISHEGNNKKNNCVENLKWCTREYNNKKMFIDGIKTSEMMHEIAIRPKLKLRSFNDNEIKDIKRKINAGMSDTQIAKEHRCARRKIYQIRVGKTYKEVSQWN